MEKQIKDSSVRLFKHSFLESLTKTSPLASIIVYGTLIVLLMVMAFMKTNLPWYMIIGLFGLGTFFWTFTEYVLHRTLFHWVTEKSWSQRLHLIIHGAHHSFPRDEARLLMPPVPGLIMAGLLFVPCYSFFFVLGVPNYSFGFFSGFLLGYLLYSFVHRAIHLRRPPKRFKPLWFHHQLHHHRYPDKAFGVSNTFWDKVFGTMPPTNTGEQKSKTGVI